MRPRLANTACDFSTSRALGGLSCACNRARNAFLPRSLKATLCLNFSPRSFSTNASICGATCLIGRIRLGAAGDAAEDDGVGVLVEPPPVHAVVRATAVTARPRAGDAPGQP